MHALRVPTQVPQSSVLPQPSLTEPQLTPWVPQSIGVHEVPQIDCEQIWPAGQPPQLTISLVQACCTGPQREPLHVPGAQLKMRSEKPDWLPLSA